MTGKNLIPLLIPAIAVFTICAYHYSSDDYDENITYVDEPGPEYNVTYDTIWVMKGSSKKTEKQLLAFENVNTAKQRTYKMSKRGHEFIKSFESCRLSAYRIRGEKYNTIGWGHYLQHKGEQNIKRISQARADELFREDIAWVDKAVTDMLNEVNASYKWPQGIVDGLGSLVYNCGEHGVRTTEFYRRLQNCRFHNGEINASDIAYTLAVVKTTRCSKPGHYKRRAGEFAMMNENFS